MDPERVIKWSEPEIGLRAFLVLDSTHLGPAAGGIRTQEYPDAEAALADARRLARAMTIKCAIAGLDAGGGKLVVMAQAGMDRPRVFRRLGELIQDLAGVFRTAGDLGTSASDLKQMATCCEFVHTDESGLCQSVGRGLAACMQALADAANREVSEIHVAVQGCGAIGSSVATGLHALGVQLSVSDLESKRANELRDSLGAKVLAASEILASQVDVLSPCAVGQVVDQNCLATMRAWGLCGAANNIIADEDTQRALLARGTLVVPDEIASAGAVIDGIGHTVMGLADRGALIDALGATAARILKRSTDDQLTSQEVVLLLAQERLGAGKL